MSQDNPFATPQTAPYDPDPQSSTKLTSGPIDIFRRAVQLLKAQFWIFMAFSCLSVLIAAMVPFGLLFGPVLVGLFLCLKQSEQGAKFDINTLLKGMERFLDSFIVMVALIVVNMLVTVPMVIGFLVLMFSQVEPGREPNVFLLFGGIFVFALLVNLISLLAHLPFLFCFQLLADRKITAIEAIKLSAKAAWTNFSALAVLCILGAVMYILAAIMCVLPIFFFIPFWIAVMFVVYRDVFPQQAE
ncbi:MAG: hypothetical protein U0930_01545 [Pirellulales bacterium]